MAAKDTPKEPRPSPPDPVARRLRQEAGFGCCVCGVPLYDYHHIIEYSHEHHFRPEDMMILCPNHHRLARRAIPKDKQREYKARPHNIALGRVNGDLICNQSSLEISAGGCTFLCDLWSLVVDKETILSFSLDEDRRLCISSILYDKNGNILAHIDKNRWSSSTPMAWDIESLEGQKLVVRRYKADISINLNTSQEYISVTASLWKNGAHVRIRESDSRVGLKKFQMMRMADNTFLGGIHGIQINTITEELRVRF